MKFKISEKRLFTIIRKFLKKNIKDEMIDDFMMDYDDTHDRIVVNIIFNDKFEHTKRGKIYEEVIEKLEDYFGVVPLVYGHLPTSIVKM